MKYTMLFCVSFIQEAMETWLVGLNEPSIPCKHAISCQYWACTGEYPLWTHPIATISRHFHALLFTWKLIYFEKILLNFVALFGKTVPFTVNNKIQILNFAAIKSLKLQLLYLYICYKSPPNSLYTHVYAFLRELFHMYSFIRISLDQKSV